MHREGKCRTCSGFGLPRCLLTFCLGAVLLAAPWPTGPWLPGAATVWAVAATAVLLLVAVLCRRGGAGRWLSWIGLPLGLAWSGLAHDAALGARLHTAPAGNMVTVSGRVVGDPVWLDGPPEAPPAQRFEALLLSPEEAAGSRLEGRRVRLSWYGSPGVVSGEVWQWTAVLKGPWSYANPGGFDYERWLLGAGLQGTGYVRSGARLEPSSPGRLVRARQALRDLVGDLDLEHGGILLALLVGDGSGISDARWNTLRATGTVHLMVISGLHVSLAAALGFAVGRTVGRACPLLPLWLDVRAAGCMAGAGVAGAYVLLAGAGLPALRALTMSAATLALLAGGRTSRLGSALLIAVALLLALQPLAIHQQGFWLSFGAVGILYLTLGHRHGEGRVRALIRAQLALSLGMLPLVAMSTGNLPWTGVPANLLAVPVMSLAVVPAALLGGGLAAVSSAAAAGPLMLADRVVDGVLGWLDWLALAPVPLAVGGALSLVVAQAGVLCWLVGVPREYLPALTLGWALPLATPASGVAHGEYRVMALDVGQGSAIAIDTRHRRLLYDAGPAYPSGFETGSAVVVPSMAATGASRLDMLVLSHDDVDHVGGAPYVRAELRPSTIVAPSADAELPCPGRSWRWDGVTFRLLTVERPPNASDNDASCILLVDDGRHRTLIAGDISARVEAKLLRMLAGQASPVHLMFAPHHGSISSSSRALVRVARPRLVLVSAGRGNRFGHPHPQVVVRYRAVGAAVFQTGREGALIWHSRTPARLLRWRRDRVAYWRSRDS